MISRIENGKIVEKGPAEKVIDLYLSNTDLCAEFKDRGPDPDKVMHFRSAKLIDNKLNIRDHFTRNESGYVEVIYDINRPIDNVHVVCHGTDLYLLQKFPWAAGLLIVEL